MAAKSRGPDDDLSFDVVGIKPHPLRDAYHHLLRGRWTVLISLAFGCYAITNLLFALLYWAEGDGVRGMREGSFSDALWFSVQTFSTIGYGALTPQTPFANVVVLVESFAGLVGTAMMAALLFAKLSRPTARVAFSNLMVVHERDGVPTLQLRIANERSNSIINAELQLVVLTEDESQEGESMRRFRNLKLERSRSPLFALTWTGIHRLDETSPLYGLNEENAAGKIVFMLATFSGTDDAFLQTVHSQKVFRSHDVRFDAYFEDMIEHLPDRTRMHYRNLHLLKDQP